MVSSSDSEPCARLPYKAESHEQNEKIARRVRGREVHPHVEA